MIITISFLMLFQEDEFAFSALTQLAGRQEGHPACKKEWWGAGVVICLAQEHQTNTTLHFKKLYGVVVVSRWPSG